MPRTNTPTYSPFVYDFASALVTDLEALREDCFVTRDYVVLNYPRGLVRLLHHNPELYYPGVEDFERAGIYAVELGVANAVAQGGYEISFIHRVVVHERFGRYSMDAMLIDRRIFGNTVFPPTPEVTILGTYATAPLPTPVPVVPVPPPPVPYDGAAIIARIRNEILSGSLTRNRYRADCYIVRHTIYVALRDACSRVLASLGMKSDLKEHQTEFLNALQRRPEVLKVFQGGAMLHWIFTSREAQKPIGAIALHAASLFDAATLEQLGCHKEEIRHAPSRR